jgi:phosphoribosylformylglycinamidine (FGAM) synthase PurS component
MQYFIEVFYKKNYGDKKTEAIKARLASAGLKGIAEVIPSVIYKLEGDYGKANIETLAAGLFADPVLETFHTAMQRPKGFFKVQVWIRDSSTDVVGESVKDVIVAMGYEKPASARACNAFAIKGGFSKAELETAVKKTFVNEVVNKFSVEEF